MTGTSWRLAIPEGLTADAAGNVYAATFETNFDRNFIYVWDPAGRLTVTVPVPSGRAPLGMVTSCHNPSRQCPAGTQKLYVNDVLNGDMMVYDLPLRANSLPVVYDICGGFLAAFGIGAPAEQFCALNANDIGPDGRVYISDNGAGPSFRLLRQVPQRAPVCVRPANRQLRASGSTRTPAANWTCKSAASRNSASTASPSASRAGRSTWPT